MSLEDFQLLDKEPLDNLIIRRDITFRLSIKEI